MDTLVYEFWNSTDMEGRWEPLFEAQRLLNGDRPVTRFSLPARGSKAPRGAPSRTGRPAGFV
jgi:hypothetical protein